jgi:uncharacterized protein YjbI with pentapeptide repeats
MRDVHAASCDFSDASMRSVDATGAVFDGSVLKHAVMTAMHAPCR